jgi:cbb3-type cytochrome oxidase cytochrome c subunit
MRLGRMLSRMSRLQRVRLGGAGLAIAAALASCGAKIERSDHPPVVPGLAAAALDAPVRGRVLLGELGCTNCHYDAAGLTDQRPGPDLQTVGARVDGVYLRRYLTSPMDAEPGTAMPDLLRARAGAALRDTAHELASYLQSFATEPVDEVAADADAAAQGEELWGTVGCRACHDANAAGMSHVPAKYTLQSLQTFLLAPHAARPAARMPKFELSPTEANALANYLMRGAGARDQAQAATDDDVARGRQHFGQLGCVSCHALEDPQRADVAKAKPLDQLDVRGGCLSGTSGAWPHYALTDEQTADLRAAIEGAPLEGEARIQQHLASRGCLACHARGDLNSLEARGELFDTHDPTLGLEGRVPPPLTGVGAKLQLEWLEDTIGHGQRERPYLKTRMPGFGDHFARRLTTLLAAHDKLPPTEIAPLPKDRKQAEAVVKVGQQLAGDKGMGCIACHLFAGEQGGSMAGIDLLHSTGKRLRPEWFKRFLLDPYAFKPGTLMPKFYPDGKSTRPEIADGDVDKQIDGMWHYLAKGRNVRKPSGLRRPPIELKVADEAVILRRAVQNTGKRGISVGYPGGVNVTFDAETLALNQIWWGRFLDARPVWTSQGHGQAHVLERRRAQLPLQPNLAPLDDPAGPWPTTTRRERGDRWLGYDLDAQQRPTLRYPCGDVEVADTLREVRDGEATVLRRILQAKGEAGLVLRLARHQDIRRTSDNTAIVAGWMQVRSYAQPLVLITDGDQRELRVALATSEQGETSQQIDYSRVESK